MAESCPSQWVEGARSLESMQLIKEQSKGTPLALAAYIVLGAITIPWTVSGVCRKTSE